MSVVSQMSLEDVGALFLGPSSLMADPFGPLLDEDEESALSEGWSSPLSSSSSLSPLSPSRPASVGCKSLSWPPELLTAQTEPEQSKGDALHSNYTTNTHSSTGVSYGSVEWDMGC